MGAARRRADEPHRPARRSAADRRRAQRAARRSGPDRSRTRSPGAAYARSCWR
jgi:hypothetical protein